MKKSAITLSPESEQVLTLLEESHHSVFLTGKAGTGKSTLLRLFRERSAKSLIVLAPTGTAAVNVRGQTVHSFFGFKPDITVEKAKRLKPKNPKLYTALQSVVIDEISMVRADLLDCIDAFLRRHGPHPGAPMGGVQLICIGDLYQLPPVVPPEEWAIFSTQYASPFFFDAHALRERPLEVIELTTVYRQRDPEFVALLDAVRTGTVSARQVDTLNARCHAAEPPPTNIPPVYVMTTNRAIDERNTAELAKLRVGPATFRGELTGHFSESQMPTAETLILKKGARIMLLNNHREGHWVNGDVGRVIGIRPRTKDGAITVALDNGFRGVVEKFTWELIRFEFNEQSGTIESRVIGSFSQYPLRLAWALTIHKAQGKTLQNVEIDFGRGTFVHGQAYVALSRCTSLNGLRLTKALSHRHIIVDKRVTHFLNRQVPHAQLSETSTSV